MKFLHTRKPGVIGLLFHCVGSGLSFDNCKDKHFAPIWDPLEFRNFLQEKAITTPSGNGARIIKDQLTPTPPVPSTTASTKAPISKNPDVIVKCSTQSKPKICEFSHSTQQSNANKNTTISLVVDGQAKPDLNCHNDPVLESWIQEQASKDRTFNADDILPRLLWYEQGRKYGCIPVNNKPITTPPKATTTAQKLYLASVIALCKTESCKFLGHQYRKLEGDIELTLVEEAVLPRKYICPSSWNSTFNDDMSKDYLMQSLNYGCTVEGKKNSDRSRNIQDTVQQLDTPTADTAFTAGGFNADPNNNSNITSDAAAGTTTTQVVGNTVWVAVGAFLAGVLAVGAVGAILWCKMKGWGCKAAQEESEVGAAPPSFQAVNPLLGPRHDANGYEEPSSSLTSFRIPGHITEESEYDDEVSFTGSAFSSEAV